MKSPHANLAQKLFFIACVAMSLAACSNSAQQKRGQTAGATPGYIGGATFVHNGQTLQCDITPNPATCGSNTSPYNNQSVCFNQALYQQAMAAGTLTACSGGSPNAQSLAQQNVPGQQGQPPLLGPDGKLLNPSVPLQRNGPGVSNDIHPDGRIIHTHMALVGGVGQESVTDNCRYQDPRDPHVQDDSKDERLNRIEKARYLYKEYDRFDLYFDDNGNLTITGQSINGQGSTPAADGPIPYKLNSDSQTIAVGPFRVIGPVRDEFKNMERMLAQRLGTLININDRRTYGVTGSSTPDGQNSMSPNANRVGFSLASDANAAGQRNTDPSGVFQAQTPARLLETRAEVEIRSPGFTAGIEVYPSQPQHITSMIVPEVAFASRTFVDAKPNPCEGNGEGHYYDLHLHPAQ